MTPNMIELPLPEGTDLAGADLTLLKAAMQTVLSLSANEKRVWVEQLHRLEDDDWHVKWGLSWSIEATKGHCCEEVSAPTIHEAFEKLTGMARLHKVEGCP